MALPALLGAGARAVGGQMVKSGGKSAAKKILKRGDKKQTGIVKKGNGQQPTGGGGALTIRPKTTMIPAKVMISKSSSQVSEGSGSNILEKIYKKIIAIDKILKGTLAEEKSRSKTEKKNLEKQRRQKQEEKLEKKKTKEEKKAGGLKIPKISFFDRIKQFVMSIITGFILKKLVDFLPQVDLVSIGNAIGTGLEVVTDLIIGVVDAAGTFLLWGQKVIDGSRDWLNENRGDKAIGRFNELLGSLGNLLNATIIVGSLAARLGSKPGTKPGTKPGSKPGVKPTKPLVRKPGPLDPRSNARNIQRKHGTAARGLYEQVYERGIKNGKSPKAAAASANAAVKRAIKKGKLVSKPQTGSLGGTDKGSSIRKGGTQRIGKRLGLKLFGKQGVKLVSKTFGKIPVMGPLIVAVASLLSGEPIGQAVFKGIGAALGGLLGSFIPIPVIGTLLGETIGVLVGDMMYSLLFEGKEGVANAGRKFMTALKTALDVGGLIVNFFKEGFGRFFNDFPTVDVPNFGIGPFTLKKALAGIFPFLDKDGDGKVGKMPNLSILFNPLAMITELIPHAAKSFLPAIFGVGGTAFGEPTLTTELETTDNTQGSSTNQNPPVSGGGGNYNTTPADVKNLEASKKGKIFLHWSAGAGTTPHPDRYHSTILADGSKVQKTPYTQFRTPRGHTAYKNSQGVGLAVAAMKNWNWSTLKPKQLDALTTEAATVAKQMGYSKSMVNVRNIATHAEAASMKDGSPNTPPMRGAKSDPDNYGPAWPGWGGDGERSDFVDINKADYNAQKGVGGNKLRAMIKGKMKIGGPTKGMGPYLLGEEGQEFVLDNDSYVALKTKYPGFLAALNSADGTEALKVLEAYASYEQGGSQTIIVNRNQIMGDMAQQRQKPQAPIVIPVGGSDATAGLYAMS